MPRRIAAVLTVCAVAVSLFVVTAEAAQPSTDTLHPKDQGTARLTYTGTVPPGAGSTPGVCEDQANADLFTLKVAGLTPQFLQTHSALLTAHIEWDPMFSPSSG